MRRGEQSAILTPGQNTKFHLTRALHAHTGRLVSVRHARMNATLSIKLTEALRRTYRSARRVIFDNYVIHKGDAVHRWLVKKPKVRLLFQSTYSPWVNLVTRLWATVHDTVIRNHRCTTFRELVRCIFRFLDAVPPFPRNRYTLANLEV